MGDRAPAAAALSPRGPATLPRPRVTDLLAAARQRRATLVVAGAGYGKTTALTEIAATGPSRWVRLKPADTQVESLAARIAAVLGEAPSAEPSGIAAATGSDDRHVLAERRAALLCELAEALQDDLLLVIDGVEHVGDDEAASHLLRVLSLEAPARLHLVLSGRSLPELGLGGAQGRGELLEVTAPDLSFTTAETARLVDVRLGPDSLPLAAECWALTGGWPAAEQLLLDRLERLAPADRGPALERLKRRAGQPWRAFARDLVGDEQPAARRVLEVAALVPQVDSRLLGGAGVAATTGDLESLQDRGLLVEAGEPGYFRLSPVLTEAARPPDAAAAGDSAAGDSAASDSAARNSAARNSSAGELRERAASWLAANGRLDEALECHADGASAAARSFLRRSGPALIRGGAAARVIEVLRRRDGPAATRNSTPYWLRRCRRPATGTRRSSCSGASSARSAPSRGRPAWRGGTVCCSTCAGTRAKPRRRCRPRMIRTRWVPTTRWCRRA